jgi:hypothetical protein
MSIGGVYPPTNFYLEKAKDKIWGTVKDVVDKYIQHK